MGGGLTLRIFLRSKRLLDLPDLEILLSILDFFNGKNNLLPKCLFLLKIPYFFKPSLNPLPLWNANSNAEDYKCFFITTDKKCKWNYSLFFFMNVLYKIHGNHIGMETLFQIVHMQKKNLQTHRKKNYLTLFIGWSKLADK